MANEGYHERIDELTDATLDIHRAITFNKQLKDYLFTNKPVAPG